MTRAANDAPTRPPIRHFGGKWLLAPSLIAMMPPHRIYTEAYGGAGSVLLRKPRSHGEVWNDLNEDVVNLFRVLREPAEAEQLAFLLENTPYARREWESCRKATRDPKATPVERARRFIVTCSMGYGSTASVHGRNTGFRANSDRSGSTPATDWANRPAALSAVTARLRGVTIECRDAAGVIRTHDSPETLHFVDPPYVHATRNLQSGRYEHELTNEDHEALLDLLDGVEGMVMLCGYGNRLYQRRLKHWRSVSLSSYADGARRRTEKVWLNPAAVAATAQLDMFEEAAS